MPLMTDDQEPLPAQFRTLIACRRIPGATPTTPFASSFAPIVPATWLPWPLQSVFGPPVKLRNSTTFRSGCDTSMPVSITYASTFVIAPEPFPASVELSLQRE
jgi:hypothetical protein